MKYFINEDESEIITRDEDGSISHFTEIEFETGEENVSEIEDTKPVEKTSVNMKERVLALLRKGMKPNAISAELEIGVASIYAIKSKAKMTGELSQTPSEELSKDPGANAEYPIDLIREYGRTTVHTIKTSYEENDSIEVAARIARVTDSVATFILEKLGLI